MPRNAHKTRLTSLQKWLFLTLLLLLPLHGLLAGEALKRRVLVGLKLFPAVLAASEALEPASGQSAIQVLIVYHDDDDYAEELAETLRGIERIRGIPLIVGTASISTLQQRSAKPPFGVFVCQRSEEEIALISRYGRQNGIITFSPFHGDVERGILAGIAISDRILPLINKQTLATLPFGLKPFFLRVAEIYEP
jgi:hypothetical protein